MAMTPAERQAAVKARKEQTIDDLTSTNAALVATVAELQAKNLELVDLLRKAELAAVTAKLKIALKNNRARPS